MLTYKRMKKLWLVLASTIFLAGCSPKDWFVKPPAALDITSLPGATVFLNEANKGSTPFSDKNIKPGSYTIKLVPDQGSNLSPYEVKLTLTSKTTTVISHTFSASDTDTAGYILQLQPDPAGQTYLSVISNPDTVNVTIDGKASGFTPLSKLPTTPGSHALVVTSPGYTQQELSVNTVTGYNLIVNFKLAASTITLTPSAPATPSATLAPTASSSPSAARQPSTIDKPYVVVGDTGTGWLRVRKDSSATSDELGKATTGEKLKYLGVTTDSGWFKVEFEGNPGWVSGRYITLVK